MLLSRGASTLKYLKYLSKGSFKPSVRNSGGHHGWNYRTGTPPSKSMVQLAEVIQGVAWWWILWHIWTEPGHILGEWEYPDPRKWSNEELGIPEELEIE